MSEPEYYYGQGIVEIAENVDGVIGDWVDVGDISELSSAVSQESLRHKESRTGKKGTVRNFSLGAEMLWNATMFKLDPSQIARFLQGTYKETASGTATGESLGTIAAGDVIDLDFMNVGSLVITDSNGTPATIASSHYEYDEFGTVKFKTLPTTPAPTNPLLAAYSYGKSREVAFLNADSKTYALRYKGVNLAEGNKKVMLVLYKISANLLQTLSMITNGNQLASAAITFEALLDTSKPAGGDLGQYGRIVYLD